MTIELYLKKYFWVVDALTVVLAALFLAKTTGHTIATEYLLTDDQPPVHYAPPPQVGAQQAVSFVDTVKRDIFCSTCAPAEPDPSQQGPAADANAPVKTTLPLTYVASFLARTPTWSFATIRNNVDHTAGVFRVGSQLPSGYGWVTEIDPARVVFQTNGHLEYMPLVDDAPGGAPSMGTPIQPRPGGLDADVAKGVRKINDYQYEIQRALLEKVLADTSILAQQVRVIPSIDPATGKPNGFKLYGIRPGSIMSAIGLQNGDTLSAINGNDISTPDKAFAVYNAVRNASMVSVNVSRSGQPHELDYTIHN